MNRPAPESASITAGAISALGASACCVLPLVLVSIGVGGAWVAQLRELERVVLDVPGMNCALCPISVKKALERVPGVLEAKADLATKSAEVTFDPARASPEALAKAVTNAGFPALIRKP